MIERPPSPAIDGVHVRARARQRDLDVLGDDPADADRERPLDDDDAPGPAEHVAHLLQRERPEGLDAERADRDALLAHRVDRVLDRAEDGPERDDDRCRRPAGGSP